ncbi:CU044_2847 family protein (plasmid) [Nostoc sp. UHCC 0926]|uniref:CU044_2847 family protein n=1 Tax=Nostoc sp. UHCC 0926 TaxID=3025190 RepID=UPI00235F1CDB|nr:CU044_2847 family protein [Nostoc sp. UHCC 0926]WDD36063.1 CU044_2847 family protein [Nostoc sp. UHCC 0926]
MTKLVKFDVGDGQTVLIEVEEVKSEEIKPVSKSPGELAAKARKTLSEALDGIEPMVRTLKQRLNALTAPEDEVEVKFGVKLSAEIDAVVTKLGSEATYEITLKWKNK